MVNRGEEKVRVHMYICTTETGRLTRQSNGSSNPEVVGSIPNEVKRSFFTSCGSPLIPFTRANAQWVIQSATKSVY